MKKKFIVKGMSCASCVAHVEKAVKKLNDANDINVSLLNNSLELETTTLTDEEIDKLIAEETADWWTKAIIVYITI